MCVDIFTEAFFLPFKNLHLFATLYVVNLAFFAGLLAWHGFGVSPIGYSIFTKVTAGVAVPSGDFIKLALVGGFLILVALVVVAKLAVVTVFAATSTYEGETLSFGELLKKAREHKKGPLVTVASTYLIGFCCAVIIGVVGGFAVRLWISGYTVWAVLLWIVYFVFLLKFLLIVLSLAVAVVKSVHVPTTYGFEAVKAAFAQLKPHKFTVVLTVLLLLVLEFYKPLYPWALWLGNKYGLLVFAVPIAIVFLFVGTAYFCFYLSVATVLYYKTRDGPLYEQLNA